MASDRAILPPGSEELLRQRGLLPPYTVRRLSGGLNNQVFLVEPASGTRVVLKAYFHDLQDPRDRLGAEYGFLMAAETLGIECVARPLARNNSHRLGLYSFLEGIPATSADINQQAIDQAVNFILHLNDAARRPELPKLEIASDAFFSISDALVAIRKRIDRIKDGLGEAPGERDIKAFFINELGPAWEGFQVGAVAGLERLGCDPAQRLAEKDRILSPSDFGFHNALRSNDGTFCFVDFEYAGWDDPAKLVGDAFNQVKVPLPLSLYPRFRDRIAAWSSQPEREARRYDLMWPLFGIKWIGIMLNEFIPSARRRRTFAGVEKPLEERLAVQLAAARAKLAEVVAMADNLAKPSTGLHNT